MLSSLIIGYAIYYVFSVFDDLAREQRAAEFRKRNGKC